MNLQSSNFCTTRERVESAGALATSEKETSMSSPDFGMTPLPVAVERLSATFNVTEELWNDFTSLKVNPVVVNLTRNLSSWRKADFDTVPSLRTRD
jgi:hypothetical protein